MINKTQLTNEVNEAYAKLISIALQLDSKFLVDCLQTDRSYLCAKIKHSNLPSC